MNDTTLNMLDDACGQCGAQEDPRRQSRAVVRFRCVSRCNCDRYCDFFSMRMARGESVITASMPSSEATAYASAESTPNATIFTSPLVLKHLTAAGVHHRASTHDTPVPSVKCSITST